MSPRPDRPPLLPPVGLEAGRFELEGEEFALLEWPVRARAGVAALTPAQREVLALAVEGLSNAEIARRRRRSPRTVANQLAALFRRLGVRSRFELIAWARGGGEAGEG